MQMLQTLSRWLTWPRPALPGRFMDGWQASMVNQAVGAPEASGFAALRRGVEIITGQLTSTPLLVFSGTEEVAGSTVHRCLQRTDPADLELGISNMVWAGNGWLTLHRDDRGAPHHLEAIQGHRMSATLVEGVVTYLKDGQPVDMADVVHLMCRNGYSNALGDGLLESYNASAAAITSVLSLHGQLHQNTGFADLFLQTDQRLSADQMRQLRTAYLDQTSVKDGKAGGTVILSDGLKASLLRKLPSALEADLEKILSFSVAEASRITGVPLSMLGVKDAVAYNSSIEASRAFHRTTVRPLMHRIERELTKKLGLQVSYDVGEIALGSGAERAETLSKLTMSGILSLNEARASLGYSPAGADGDVLRVPLNQAPVNQPREAA